MEIDNRSIRLGDELKKELKSESRVKIAAATFSMFAYQQLKEELENIEELKFIFTNPTFITDETKTDFREYTIPKKEREQSIFGGKYELKLMNELTQKRLLVNVLIGSEEKRNSNRLILKQMKCQMVFELKIRMM